MGKKDIVLCDTNIIIKYLRGEIQIYNELDRLGFSNLYISAVSVAEIYYGMKKSETRKTKELLNKFNLVHLNKGISVLFLEIIFNYKSQIKIPDAVIAATALDNNMALFTLNTKDFSFIPGLTLYKPHFTV